VLKLMNEIKIDLKAFWEENEYCRQNFDKKTRIPIHFWLDDHFLFELVGPFSTVKYYTDKAVRSEIHKKANDILEKELGRRFYSEEELDPPEPARFEVVMGSKVVISEGGTPWLEPAIDSVDEVKDLIRKLEKVEIKNVVSAELIEAKNNYELQTGKKLRWGSMIRGPATIATSLLGTTNLCILLMDEPELMDEFFKILGTKLVEYIRLLRSYCNIEYNGISINDDNCFLFSPKLYERYCAPIMEKLFKEFAPNKTDTRYQHSDSNMQHIIPILNGLGVNAVNFGPEIHPATIRKLMPNALIYGQMPPFVLRNGTKEEIIEIVKRDMNVLKADGNFVETPAGSVASGTPLENIRIYMWAVQEYGRL